MVCVLYFAFCILHVSLIPLKPQLLLFLFLVTSPPPPEMLRSKLKKCPKKKKILYPHTGSGHRHTESTDTVKSCIATSNRSRILSKLKLHINHTHSNSSQGLKMAAQCRRCGAKSYHFFCMSNVCACQCLFTQNFVTFAMLRVHFACARLLLRVLQTLRLSRPCIKASLE